MLLTVRVGCCPYPQILDRIEKLSRDKRSSLFASSHQCIYNWRLFCGADKTDEFNTILYWHQDTGHYGSQYN